VEVAAGRKPPRDAAPVTSDEGPDHLQLLGRILVARNGWPDALEPPAPALAEPKGPAAVPELKDPQLLPPSILAPGPRWIALENTYFIAAFVVPKEGRALRARTRESTEVGIVFPDVRLQGGRSWEGRATAYVGPKEWNRLTALAVGLEGAQARNYGYLLWLSSWGTPPLPFPWMPMEWFCVPLLWLMNLFATYVPGQNLGVAIILLTVLVKILFYPLTHKSMASMKAMQALQPQINALRAKYKADPQRFQREQMDLFRRHRVNPMGGCLPMVVQVPIFYALYLTLQFSVELQGAPFLLWVTDLSRKDPYYVLPILMGASMLVQQMMTPSVGDPRQRNIMLLMPVIFTFMFLEFPTGLVLYWLVNNVLSIAQQYAIDRAVARKGSTPGEKVGREARKA
jgi:YidC/Oxa1 family membrane protein insertase